MERRTEVPTAALTALLVSIAALVTLGGCGDGVIFPPPGPTLAIGTWGGDDAGVIVTEFAVHVHIGCTFGDIVGSIPLDGDGRFQVDGSYVPRAYPVQSGPPVPARFSGHVVGRTLTLAVAVNDTVEGGILALGPVDVLYGREPEMQICPICRVPGQRRPGSSLGRAWPRLVP